MNGPLVCSGALVLAFVLGVGGSASAQVKWTEVTVVTPRPSPRWPTLAFDAIAGRTLLFGGLPASGPPLADTWLWDGAAWAKVYPAISPPARFRHTLTHMAHTRSTVLFGGGGPLGTTLSDTWIWDGQSWASVTGPGPSPRLGHAAAYDEARNRVVLFGGQRPAEPGRLDWYLDDTWEFDGQRWTQRTPACSPLHRVSAAMANDSHRRKVVLFGGRGYGGSYSDTWEWDGIDWAYRTDSGPTIRMDPALAYDPVRRRAVLFGGAWVFVPGVELDDTWEWDGTRWEHRFPTTRPRGRFGASSVYDSRAGCIVLFGGMYWAPPFTDVYLGDLWTYATDAVGTYRSFGSSCGGATGTPTLATREPGDRPWLGQTFALTVSGLAPSQPVAMLTGFSDTTWNGLRLPLPLDGIGMPRCLLYTAPDDIVGLSNAAGTATWTVSIPLDVGVRGLPFFNQAIVFDPAANALGVVTTNAGAGIVGVL